MTLFSKLIDCVGFYRRVAVRKDSCSIVAISLNIQEKVHPIIWSLEGLPFDCEQVIPIPKPIGKQILAFPSDCQVVCSFVVPSVHGILEAAPE